jgi:hypothetical protein
MADGPDDPTSRKILAIKLGVVAFGVIVFIAYALSSALR